MRQRNHLERNQDLFAYIPSEIIIGILSRLPVRTIISCKCVCKSWLTLLESHEFVRSHLCKSIPGLAIYGFELKLYKVYDFEDGLDLEHHGLHYKSVTKFNIPGCEGWISGSANGLLFLCNRHGLHALHICNPITRDYIELDCNEFTNSAHDVATYGFGLSKITGQYKVVRIFQDYVIDLEGYRGNWAPKSECVCHVYTIGTALWRRVSPVTGLVYGRYNDGAFLNGNLHWSVSAFEDPRLRISCFDLETERFSTFSSPLIKSADVVGPTVLGDCLCLCYYSRAVGIVIWLMKEYGVEESWTKLIFFGGARPSLAVYICHRDIIFPIKIFKDGDILLARDHEFLLYSKKNNTVQKFKAFEPHDDIDAYLYTPSFLSLKSFGREKVISF